jgi:hypothetical protein
MTYKRPTKHRIIMETLTIAKKSTITEQILPEVQMLNFDRIKFKLLHKDSSIVWTKEKAEFAETEYRRYLTLIKLYPNKGIVPSKIMDEFWHQHILDTQAYREDCQTIFGRFIDHFPYFGIYGTDDRQDLLDTFEETKALYKKRFGIELGEEEDQDPSKCKCRTNEQVNNEMYSSKDPSKCKCRTDSRRNSQDPSKCKCRTSDN